MIQTGPAACLIRKNVMEPGSEDEGRPGRSCDINAGNRQSPKSIIYYTLITYVTKIFVAKHDTVSVFLMKGLHCAFIFIVALMGLAFYLLI